MRKLELLAPAKSYEYGVEAIKCGADALYIGAPQFGARSAASNSYEDIAKLAKYAHKFGVRLFVTVNTILYDSELREAQKMIWRLYECGVDAIIVQDMALLEMDLPPLELHASTQAAALTPQRAQFYEKAGFERIVVERASSINQIKEISISTSAELEAFVFGAICVSYSGQCYLSHVVASRSGNRGVCSQPCRSRYDLVDEKGAVIVRDKHLLSLKDLNLDHKIGDLIDAGVSSFKIEGRLKELAYLRNVITHFNKIINDEISLRNGYERSSKGEILTSFEPNPIKTFNRGFTPYFIDEKREKMANFATAKAIGEPLAKVTDISGDRVRLDRSIVATPGDGVWFIDRRGCVKGAYVNCQEADSLILSNTLQLYPGAMLYRNFDKKFNDEAERFKSRRVYPTAIKVLFEGSEMVVEAKTENSKASVVRRGLSPANNCEKTLESIKSGLSKSGETIFNVTTIDFEGEPLFIPAKEINSLRRELLDRVEEGIIYTRKLRKVSITHPPLVENVAYKYNVTNHLSEQFYRLCGAKTIIRGVEQRGADVDTELMRMKYCLRGEIGECLMSGGRYKELYIVNNGRKFRLKFHCDSCEMSVHQMKDNC